MRGRIHSGPRCDRRPPLVLGLDVVAWHLEDGSNGVREIPSRPGAGVIAINEAPNPTPPSLAS